MQLGVRRFAKVSEVVEVVTGISDGVNRLLYVTLWSKSGTFRPRRMKQVTTVFFGVIRLKSTKTISPLSKLGTNCVSKDRDNL